MENKYNINDIRTISLTESVRIRPKLYFSTCFLEENLNILPLEMACHAIDEFVDGNCTYLKIKLYEDYFSLEYDAGMKLTLGGDKEKTIAEMFFTTLFTCHNLKKHLAVGEEFCRIGVCPINAAAEWCEVATISERKKGLFHFEKGIITSRQFEATEESNSTLIKIKPDPSIFGNLRFTLAGVEQKTTILRTKLKGFKISVISAKG